MRRTPVIPSALLDDIYACAIDRAHWGNTLESISRCVGGDAGAVFCMDPSTDRVLFYQDRGLDEEANRRFLESHQINPWTPVMTKAASGRLVLSDELLPLSQLRRSGFYCDVLRPQGLAHNAMAVLARRETSYMAFNVLRSKHKGPFKPVEIQMLREILPHLHRALTLGFRAHGFNGLRDLSMNILDGLAGAVVLLDKTRRPVFANEAALRLNEFLLLGGTKLLLRNSSQQHRLSNGLTRVFGGTPMVTLDFEREGQSRLRIVIFSIRGNDFHLMAGPGGSSPAVAVFVLDQGKPSLMCQPELVALYQLTRAEARVAMAALETDDIRELAARLMLSANTIKTHLKRIYSKVGVRSRVQLMREFAAWEQ